MSMFTRIGAVSVVGFAFSTGASVQAMEAAADFDDLLLIDEAPLTSTELSEARGGFSFGGFNFDFGVDIAPVEVLPQGGPFGEGGVFGENGGPFGESGGPFGEGGVFGNNNGNSNQNAAPAETVSSNAAPTVVAMTPVPQSSAPVTQSSTPVTQTSVAPPPVVQSSAPSAPPATTMVAQNNVPISAPPSPAVVQPSTTSPVAVVTTTPVSMQADDPNAAQSNQTPAFVQLPTSTPATPSTKVANAGNAPAPAAQATESKPAPAAAYTSSSKNTISQVTQRMGPNGRSVIIDNNMNGVMLRQTIDVNVRVLNFNSRINRAIADTVTATLTSRNLILNSF